LIGMITATVQTRWCQVTGSRFDYFRDF
jgi:hypothetical protein